MRMAMMAITTSNSISVKPRRRDEDMGFAVRGKSERAGGRAWRVAHVGGGGLCLPTTGAGGATVPVWRLHCSEKPRLVGRPARKHDSDVAPYNAPVAADRRTGES